MMQGLSLRIFSLRTHHHFATSGIYFTEPSLENAILVSLVIHHQRVVKITATLYGIFISNVRLPFCMSMWQCYCRLYCCISYIKWCVSKRCTLLYASVLLILYFCTSDTINMKSCVCIYYSHVSMTLFTHVVVTTFVYTIVSCPSMTLFTHVIFIYTIASCPSMTLFTHVTFVYTIAGCPSMTITMCCYLCIYYMCPSNTIHMFLSYTQ